MSVFFIINNFAGAKLLQKFGINKDLTVKIKFILIFSGKYWVFAQGCEIIVRALEAKN